MKVCELIEKLKAFPSDMRVVAPGYDDDFDDVIEADQVLIKLDATDRHWCYGRHEYLMKPEPGAETAVRLKTNRRWEDEGK
jgi:hypothetical protein